MSAEDFYQFKAAVRYSAGTYIARANGFTASCTSDERAAAENAGQKAFEAFCKLNGIDPKNYQRGSVPKSTVGVVIYEINFTRSGNGLSRPPAAACAAP